ncbi:MAG: hypothetical protein ACRDZ4_10965 [Egibacteraceae bacterium]
MARPKKKAAEVHHIVRRWGSSPIIYGFDSRFDRKENPAYHNPIALTSRGKFVDDAGAVLDPKDVPEYVRAEAKKTNLDIEYRPPAHRDLSMRDAMTAAGVQDTEPDATKRSRRTTAAIFA